MVAVIPVTPRVFVDSANSVQPASVFAGKPRWLEEYNERHSPFADAAIASAASKIPLAVSAAMQIIITAVGPANRGLADPIVHYVTGQGANIAEIQMYDHDRQRLFAMLLRVEMPREAWANLSHAMVEIGKLKELSIRVWSPQLREEKPRLAICTIGRISIVRYPTPLSSSAFSTVRQGCEPLITTSVFFMDRA